MGQVDKKIAFLIKHGQKFFEKNAGAKYGGIYVVARNLYFTLLNNLGYKIVIYSFNFPEITEHNNEFININTLFETYTPTKLLEYLATKDYEKIISIDFDDIFYDIDEPQEQLNTHINNINKTLPLTILVQQHSIGHRIKNTPLLYRFFRYQKDKNRYKKQKNIKNLINENYKFFTVSKILQRDYLHNVGIPQNQIFVAYPGCNLKEITNICIDTTNKITFGIVANSSLNKGGHYFLLACGFAKLLGAKFNIKIIAPKYNKDICMKFLVKLFNLNEQIEILPKQNNMDKFYEEINCLVLPSKNETFGLVALEAMSFGKIALVSNTCGCCEIITKENGFVFNRKSLLDFSKKLLEICKLYYNSPNIIQKLSLQAQATSKAYNWTRFAKEILS